jgi:ADP-heptose:LPS heptosyltransferase
LIDQPANICILHFGQLGDVLLALPAISEIRKKFGRSKLTLIGGKPTQLLKDLNVVDDVLAVDRVGLLRGKKLHSIAELFKIVGEVRRRRFDLVIDLHSLKETNILGYLSGARQRLFANRQGRSLDFLSNYRPKPLREDRSQHVASYYVRALEPLGIYAAAHPIRIVPREDDLRLVASLRSGAGITSSPRIGLFLGAGHPSRRWQTEKFAELARRLIDTCGASIEVITGPEEKDLLPDIISQFPAEARIYDRLDLLQSAAAFAGMDLLVSHDTGPTHLAAAVGTPLVVIQGAPYDPKFTPLAERLELVTSAPVHEISVEDVFRSCLLMLSSTQAK